MTETSVANSRRPDEIVPANGAGIELLPGLFWLRIPLPMELNHINVWLIREDDGWSLIDTGLDTPQGRSAWRELSEAVLEGLPVRRIIVTHFHPDHMGLTEYLRQRFDAEVWMTAATESRARSLRRGLEPEQTEAVRDYCRAHGIERVDDYIAFLSGAGYRRVMSGIPDTINRITDESPLMIGGRAWTPIITHGHAPGHMSLYCDDLKVLISGDQVLPGITCNISVLATNRDEDALADYLDSLRRFAVLPEDTLVLPSHGRVFTGLHDRLDFIEQHHGETLDRITELCAEPVSAGALAPRLFRRHLDGTHYCLAVGEATAHLIYLYHRGRLGVREENGVCYFTSKQINE